MYKVFFQDKTIIFVDGRDPAAEYGNCMTVDNSKPIAVANVLENLQNNKTLVIKSPHAEEALRLFSSGFDVVDAAGGVVRNSAGDTLMIFRTTRWDLPKGHHEKGETICECALREVLEECGVEDLVAGEPITTTIHFYHAMNRWTMKRTAWFHMRSEQKGLTPQREEGIRKAEWVPLEKIPLYTKNTFLSIKEVLREAGILQ